MKSRFSKSTGLVMLRRIIIHSVAFLLFANSAMAEEVEHFGSGAGTQTCAQFANNYVINPETIENVYFSWAQGFMTGWNIASEESKTVDVATWSIDAQKAHIRHYCDANPLKEYVFAVVNLLMTMKIDANSASG
jgi:hypothetical protein